MKLPAKRRALFAAALAVLVAGGAALALTGGAAEGEDEPAAAPTATGTGKVERRTLAEQLTVSGTIGYAGESTVLARLAGTVTALPAVGDRVERGQQLYALGGEPVLLMYGEVPAYRALAEGVDDGPDVEQLEENLAQLGYEPGTVNEEFTATTAAAVEAWQEDLGLEDTGEVELGRVAFLPGPRRVTAVEATLGEALGASGGSGGGEEPQGEGSSSSVPVLETSSTKRVVTVELDPDQQSIAHRGQKVEVVLSGGEEAKGKVKRLAATEGSAAAGEETEPGVEVTVAITGKTKIPALDGASVSVLFTQQVRKHVLSVPLTALVAVGGERFAVYVRDGGARQQVIVTPGLAADGYVEVGGKGLRAGMKVETGE